MLTILFKISFTFFILTVLTLFGIKLLGMLFEDEVIDCDYEEKTAEITIKLLIGFASVTVVTAILWVFGIIWSV